MTASELLQAGQLAAATEAAVAAVKQSPTEMGRRFLLAELLCFQGEWERADKQLETLMQQADESALRVMLFRQLLRAETARRQFYTEGRLPEFVAEVSPSLRLHLDASIALREGKPTEAMELLEQAENQRPRVTGKRGDQSFDDLRDVDDMNAGYFEVLTSNGKYYWIPTERIESMEFEKPQRPIDLIWRCVHLNVTDGPEGNVYLPALYVDTPGQPDEQLRLGRGTEWIGGDGSPARGIGQRIYLIGDEAIPIMQLDKIEFVTSADAQ